MYNLQTNVYKIILERSSKEARFTQCKRETGPPDEEYYWGTEGVCFSFQSWPSQQIANKNVYLRKETIKE